MNRLATLDEPQGGAGSFVAHMPAILWHRRWFIIIPAVLAIIGAIAAVFLIPPTYQSSALMLVQSPQLAVGTDASEVIDRRIARIAEQITSRPDLVSLIEKYGLYREERDRKPLSEILTQMRDAIHLTPTGADASGAGPENRTIAFRLSFDYGAAAQSQAVTQDLMQRIVELDSTGNSEQAARRVDFLTEQAKSLEQRIGDIQGKIAQINIENGGVLGGAGMMMLGNTGSYDIQIAQLQRENTQLVAQRELARNSDIRDPVVVQAEQQLASARAVYAENHPDVVIARQKLAEAQELAKSNIRKLPVDNIDKQIEFNNNQMAQLRSAKALEMSQVTSARSAQARTPLIQNQIANLQQQLTAVNEQYKDVSNRLFAARAGVRAEDEQMGERLTVVDPPVIPDTPIWPDRLLIAAMGLGGGLGFGFVLALAIELLLGPIRDPSTLVAIVGTAPLAMIPLIATRRQLQPNRKRWLIFGRRRARSR